MKKDTIGVIYVLIAGLLWGTMGVFVNYFGADSGNTYFFGKPQGLGSIEISGIRMFFAAVIVVLFLLIKSPKLLKIKISDIWCFLGSGLVSLMIFTICYFETIKLASMSIAAVLLYTSPVFVIVLSFIFFKEKITKIKAVSCIVCVGGTALVSGILGSGTVISPVAFLLGISSGIAYALYSIFSRFALQKNYASITITVYTFIFATLGIVFFIDFPSIADSIAERPVNLGIMALMGLLTAVLPYLFYTMGLEKIESGKAAVVAAIEPVVAVIIGGIFFNDNLSYIQYLGIVLVIFSIAIQNIKQKSKE